MGYRSRINHFTNPNFNQLMTTVDNFCKTHTIKSVSVVEEDSQFNAIVGWLEEE